MKQYVLNTVEALHNIGTVAHLGLVSFNNAVDDAHVVRLTSHEKKNQFIEDVKALPWLDGGTRIDLGMAKALELFEQDKRQYAHNTVVLLTDGDGSYRPLADVGQEFHDENIRILVAAIGDEIKVDELKSMTHDPSETHERYFPVEELAHIAHKKTVDTILQGCNFAHDCHS